MLGSAYVSAAPHSRILGLARAGAGPAPTDEFCRTVGLRVNPALYALGGAGKFGQIARDITLGNNAFIGGVPGYSARLGWNPASGWGMPNFVEFPDPWIE